MDVSECCSLRRMGRPSRRSDEAICQCGDAENSGPAGTCSIGLDAATFIVNRVQSDWPSLSTLTPCCIRIEGSVVAINTERN